MHIRMIHNIETEHWTILKKQQQKLLYKTPCSALVV